MVVVVLGKLSFAGIGYNERKNEEGKRNFVAENFAMNQRYLKKSDYIGLYGICL